MYAYINLVQNILIFILGEKQKRVYRLIKIADMLEIRNEER